MLWVGWLVLHFSVIGLVSMNDLLSLPNSDASRAPSKNMVVKAQAAISRLLGEDAGSSVYREGLACYANAAGIELGYSYFAPSIPENCLLIFELRYPNGRVTYELPQVGGDAAGFRLAASLDRFRHLDSTSLRKALALTLVSPVCEEHPEAIGVRAIFGRVDLPGAVEFLAGATGAYRRLSEYDFVPPSGLAQADHR